MAKIHPQISEELKSFIEAQHIFFTGTAMKDGRVNVSPKGMDSLRVTGPNKIIWRNVAGSGNKTATRLQHVNRINLMWCALEEKPLILRCYGSAKIYNEKDSEFAQYNALFPVSNGARKIFEVDVDTIQTSCGFAVPLMDFKEERQVLAKWAENKGLQGSRNYWE